jgi:hypothetical protein
MATIDPIKAWALFMSDPGDFIVMFAAVIVAVAVFTWWFRGFIHNERMALSVERAEKAREDAKELAQKLRARQKAKMPSLSD